MPSAVGRYRIDRVLGSGAFASVWLAHDEVLDAPVAVKVLAGGLIDDLDVRNRFLEEARILRRADSERLVRVHDIGELDDGRPYFVMSYADRGTLADRMRQGELPVTDALRLAIDIAHGVEVINRLGIIHRDLKPSNILFQSTTDGGERLLIADLGLAKALAHASGAFTLPVGTPGYMSPEQARFGGGLDVRADVYGLGALTYHLLTGRAPGPAPVQVPPSAQRPGLPPVVDEIVMRALEGDRERRWPSAEAFAAALSVPLLSADDDTTVRDIDDALRPETMLDTGSGSGTGPNETLLVPPVPFDEPGPPHDPDAERRSAGPGRSGPPEDPGETLMTPPPTEADLGERTVVDMPIDGPQGAGRHRDGAGGARAGGSGGPGGPGGPGGSGRTRMIVVASLAAVLVAAGGGAFAIAKLTGSSSKPKDDGLVTVTDVTGRLSIRVPPAWKLQRDHTTWPVPVADRAQAPALRATPDYDRFVKDDVPTPGVFAGLTRDLKVTLPPETLGRHRAKCTQGTARPYRHGTLSGQITPWKCGASITISEVGLRDSGGKYAMWVRVKLAGGPDITKKILDGIRTKG